MVYPLRYCLFDIVTSYNCGITINRYSIDKLGTADSYISYVYYFYCYHVTYNILLSRNIQYIAYLVFRVFTSHRCLFRTSRLLYIFMHTHFTGLNFLLFFSTTLKINIFSYIITLSFELRSR
jgi:hypothetical protein